MSGRGSSSQQNEGRPVVRGKAPGPVELRLPELDASALPGALVVRRTVIVTLGAVLGLLIALVAAVSLLSVEVTAEASGTLEPARVWPVRAASAGTIASVLVSAGDTVRTGQQIVRLDTVAAALALAELRALEAGQQVDHQRLIRIGPIRRRQAEIALEQTSTHLLRARATMRERLVEFGIHGDVDSVLATYRRGTHVGLDAVVADLDAARTEADAARGSLALAELAPFDVAKQATETARTAAQVSEREAILMHGVLLAPADGVVLTEQTERLTGAAVREGDTVLEIADRGSWRATVLVRDRDVHRMRVGDMATVEIPAIATLRDDPVGARVLSIASEPVGSTGTAGNRSDAVTSLPSAAGGYRVVLALNQVQTDSLGIDVVRRGYAVHARIVTRRTRASVLVREWLRDRLRGRA